MATYEIPLTPEPQKLVIELAGKTYSLFVYWNFAASCWMLNIFSEFDGAILTGIPLVVGSNLLEQYAYLELGGSLIANTGDDTGPPSYANLGTIGHLYFVTS
jgi:hypothetical protein